MKNSNDKKLLRMLVAAGTRRYNSEKEEREREPFSYYYLSCLSLFRVFDDRDEYQFVVGADYFKFMSNTICKRKTKKTI